MKYHPLTEKIIKAWDNNDLPEVFDHLIRQWLKEKAFDLFELKVIHNEPAYSKNIKLIEMCLEITEEQTMKENAKEVNEFVLREIEKLKEEINLLGKVEQTLLKKFREHDNTHVFDWRDYVKIAEEHFKENQ